MNAASVATECCEDCGHAVVAHDMPINGAPCYDCLWDMVERYGTLVENYGAYCRGLAMPNIADCNSLEGLA